GITTNCHENTADASLVVTRVERVPFPAEENFKPCAEVHRVRSRWNPDVAEVTAYIARRDIEAPAKGNRKMHEIAADPLAIAINFQRTFLRIGEAIAKGDVVVHPIADRLHPRPAWPCRTKKSPRFIAWFIDFTVTAPKQQTERFVW